MCEITAYFPTAIDVALLGSQGTWRKAQQPSSNTDTCADQHHTGRDERIESMANSALLAADSKQHDPGIEA